MTKREKVSRSTDSAASSVSCHASGEIRKQPIRKTAELVIDGECQAAYIYVTREKVASTIEGDHNVNIDVDADGNVIGVELIGFSFKK